MKHYWKKFNLNLEMHNPEGIFFLIYYILTLGLKIIFDLFLSLIVFLFFTFLDS